MLEGGDRSHRGKRGRWVNGKPASSSSVLKPVTKSLFKKARDEEKTGVIKVSTSGVKGIFYICKDPLHKRSALTSSLLTMVSHNVSITTSSD